MNKDILLKLAEINNYEDIGSWFSISKDLRRYLLRKDILKRIVDFCLNKNPLNIPDWVFNSIKLDESLSITVPSELNNLQKTMVAKLGDKLQEISSKHQKFFITGGFASSCIFDTNYSDIDIWVEYSEKMKERKKECFEGTDYVPSFDIIRSISDFDISLVQIGVLFDHNNHNTPVATYFTPLFLYSLYFKEMLIRIMPLKLGYTIPSRDFFNRRDDRRDKEYHCIYLLKIFELHNEHNRNGGTIKGVKHYFEENYLKYCNKKKIPFIEKEEDRIFDFHDCIHCKVFMKSKLISNMNTSNELIKRWFKRIKKYVNRFEHLNMNIIYVFSKRLKAPDYFEKEVI